MSGRRPCEGEIAEQGLEEGERGRERENELLICMGRGGKNGDNTRKGPGAGVGLELPRAAGAEGTGGRVVAGEV